MERPASASHPRLAHWRELRRTLNEYLTLYLTAGLQCRREFTPPRTKALCQHLIDYIFTGHFLIYPSLADVRHDADTCALLARNYRNIIASTDRALRFNDKYGRPGGRPDPASGLLAEDLYRLNRALLVRFVLEEQLIALAAD